MRTFFIIRINKFPFLFFVVFPLFFLLSLFYLRRSLAEDFGVEKQWRINGGEKALVFVAWEYILRSIYLRVPVAPWWHRTARRLFQLTRFLKVLVLGRCFFLFPHLPPRAEKINKPALSTSQKKTRTPRADQSDHDHLQYLVPGKYFLTCRSLWEVIVVKDL